MKKYAFRLLALLFLPLVWSCLNQSRLSDNDGYSARFDSMATVSAEAGKLFTEAKKMLERTRLNDVACVGSHVQVIEVKHLDSNSVLVLTFSIDKSKSETSTLDVYVLMGDKVALFRTIFNKSTGGISKQGPSKVDTDDKEMARIAESIRNAKEVYPVKNGRGLIYK